MEPEQTAIKPTTCLEPEQTEVLSYLSENQCVHPAPQPYNIKFDLMLINSVLSVSNRPMNPFPSSPQTFTPPPPPATQEKDKIQALVNNPIKLWSETQLIGKKDVVMLYSEN